MPGFTGKHTAEPQIGGKQLGKAREKLVEQAKRIAKPPKGPSERTEIFLCNSMAMGTQNCCHIATHVNICCSALSWAVMPVLANRMKTNKGSRLARQGKPTNFEKSRYGNSKTQRFEARPGSPICPIGHARHKRPKCKPFDACQYTAEGRSKIHGNLRINAPLTLGLMRQGKIWQKRRI